MKSRLLLKRRSVTAGETRRRPFIRKSLFSASPDQRRNSEDLDQTDDVDAPLSVLALRDSLRLPHPLHYSRWYVLRPCALARTRDGARVGSCASAGAHARVRVWVRVRPRLRLRLRLRLAMCVRLRVDVSVSVRARVRVRVRVRLRLRVRMRVSVPV